MFLCDLRVIDILFCVVDDDAAVSSSLSHLSLRAIHPRTINSSLLSLFYSSLSLSLSRSSSSCVVAAAAASHESCSKTLVTFFPEAAAFFEIIQKS